MLISNRITALGRILVLSRFSRYLDHLRSERIVLEALDIPQSQLSLGDLDNADEFARNIRPGGQAYNNGLWDIGCWLGELGDDASGPIGDLGRRKDGVLGEVVALLELSLNSVAGHVDESLPQ